MTVSVPKLPDSIGVGAQVSFVPSTAKTPSESGNKERKLLAPIRRNYMVGVSPDDSLEVQKIIMAVRGDRRALCLRDPLGFQFDNDVLDHDVSGNGLLGRRWSPVTGSDEYFQRVFLPDGVITFTKNGSAATPTVNDYGVLDFGSPLGVDDEVVAVSGDYLTPVCLMDTPSATAVGRIGTTVIYQWSDLRFEEIFEREFRDLTS